MKMNIKKLFTNAIVPNLFAIALIVSSNYLYEEAKSKISANYNSKYNSYLLADELRQSSDEERPKDLTGKGKILLVEDEEAVRMFAARALRNKGYTVLEADCGEAALACFNEQNGDIDLLVSDVVMPQMDGPTLVREVRLKRPDLKVIFISGYAEDAFRKNLDPDREFELLPKPFSLKQLAGRIKDVIGG